MLRMPDSRIHPENLLDLQSQLDSEHPSIVMLQSRADSRSILLSVFYLYLGARVNLVSAELAAKIQLAIDFLDTKHRLVPFGIYDARQRNERRRHGGISGR